MGIAEILYHQDYPRTGFVLLAALGRHQATFVRQWIPRKTVWPDRGTLNKVSKSMVQEYKPSSALAVCNIQVHKRIAYRYCEKENWPPLAGHFSVERETTSG
jgi:hypothetical protein